MCVSDWRLGRFIKSAARLVTVANAVPVLIGSNQQRVGIIISGDLANLVGGAALVVSVGGATLGIITVQTPVVRVTLDDDGELPTREFTLLTPAGQTVVASVTELFLPQAFLDKETKQWQQELMRVG